MKSRTISELVFSPKLCTDIPSQNVCTPCALWVSILFLFCFSLGTRQDYLVCRGPDYEHQYFLTGFTVSLWTQKEFTMFLIINTVPSLMVFLMLHYFKIDSCSYIPNHFPLKFLWSVSLSQIVSEWFINKSFTVAFLSESFDTSVMN